MSVGGCFWALFFPHLRDLADSHLAYFEVLTCFLVIDHRNLLLGNLLICKCAWGTGGADP
jgi:hypothetical protein